MTARIATLASIAGTVALVWNIDAARALAVGLMLGTIAGLGLLIYYVTGEEQ